MLHNCNDMCMNFLSGKASIAAKCRETSAEMQGLCVDAAKNFGDHSHVVCG